MMIGEDTHAWLSAIGFVCWGASSVEYHSLPDAVMVKWIDGGKVLAEMHYGGHLLVLYAYRPSDDARRLLGAFALQQEMRFEYRSEAA